MEKAHSVNGVPGRYRYIKTPGVRAAHCHGAQKWVSEPRPITGYGRGSVLVVEIRYDDECKNGHNSFALTAAIKLPLRGGVEACGCLHDDIARVFPELAHLIKWHLCSDDGPMQYIANTLYHAEENGPTHAWVYYSGMVDPLGIREPKEELIGYEKADIVRKAEGQPGYSVKWDETTAKTRNLAYARSSAVWPDATDEQLCAAPEVLKAALEARLPGLIARMRADIEAIGFVWEATPA